jgi:hypothetical protein
MHAKTSGGSFQEISKKFFLLHVMNYPQPKLLDIKPTREGYIPFATIFSQEFL